MAYIEVDDAKPCVVCGKPSHIVHDDFEIYVHPGMCAEEWRRRHDQLLAERPPWWLDQWKET